MPRGNFIDRPLISYGDITVAKEWTFTGDVVAGMLTLVEQDEVHGAIIGSGQAYTIANSLECCFEVIGRD